MSTEELVAERGSDYGHPREDFSRTAKLWSALKGIEFIPEDVAMFMICVKLSRETHKHKSDNIEDIKGYAECLRRLYED